MIADDAVVRGLDNRTWSFEQPEIDVPPTDHRVGDLAAYG